MIDVNADLLTVIDAVSIESPQRYSLLGMGREIPQRPHRDSVSDEPGPAARVSILGDDLYINLYIRPTELSGRHRADVLTGLDFAASLSAANCGHGTWEPGWTIRAVEEDGRVVVVKKTLAFWTPSTKVRAEGESVQPGARCRVHLGKELRSRLPGFYLALGNEDEECRQDDDSSELQIRYYWHLKTDAAESFVATTTSLFNAARIPFRLKVLSDPAAYYRADSGVLYISPKDEACVRDLVAEIYSRISWGLRPEVPLFSKPMADGLGVCEFRAGSHSFGEGRCRLIAQSLWDSHARGYHDRVNRAEALSLAFANSGRDPLRPYVETPERDESPFLPLSVVSEKGTRTTWRGRESVSADMSSIVSETRAKITTTPLEAAIRIGSLLCQSAVWDRELRLCNWMGRSGAETSNSMAEIAPVSSALGADLYKGSAGIALFLAHLFRVTSDPIFYRVARGALDRSIRQLDRMRSEGQSTPISFYCGHLGVAIASVTPFQKLMSSM
jgi:HopA1 effector protein family/Lanthionine synthetase C-like protein